MADQRRQKKQTQEPIRLSVQPHGPGQGLSRQNAQRHPAGGLELPLSYPETWVVDVKSVGTGQKALVYLGRYLYKGVIQENDIIACENGQVTFRYRDSKTKRSEYRTVSGASFLWLILQHVLPKGFRRARNFGFLHPNSKRLIALLQYLLGFDRALAWVKKRPQLTCRCCGAVMNIVRTRILPVFPVLAG